MRLWTVHYQDHLQIQLHHHLAPWLYYEEETLHCSNIRTISFNIVSQPLSHTVKSLFTDSKSSLNELLRNLRSKTLSEM